MSGLAYTQETQSRDLPFTNLQFHLGSVVGVHGLHGQSRETWVDTSSTVPGKTWLANAFSGASPKPARVILYGYDSSEDTGRCYTSRGVYQEAEALLNKLLLLRTPDDAVCFHVSNVRGDVSIANLSLHLYRAFDGPSSSSPTTLEV